MEYIISKVHSNVDSWSWNGRQLLDYAVQFDGVDGWIKYTIANDKPAPRVGDRIEGTIETKVNKRTNVEYKKFSRSFKGGRGHGPDANKEVMLVLESISQKQDEILSLLKSETKGGSSSENKDSVPTLEELDNLGPF